MDYDDSNIFAKILRGEIPADVVHEDDRCLAFRDVSPQAPVHCLVIPKEPIVNAGTATADQSGLLGHLMWVGAEVARKEGVGDAFRLVTNAGESAGQSVFHLHVHVLGGRPLGWPPG